MSYLLTWIGASIGFFIGAWMLDDRIGEPITASFYGGGVLLMHWWNYGRGEAA